MSERKFFSFLLPALLGFFLIPVAPAVATGIPCSNPHTATAADVAAGYPAGAQVCPQDEQAVSPDSGTAKQYLKTIATGRAASSADRIDQLNPGFAVCAAKFLKFAGDNGKNPKITDAVRTYAEQNAACSRYRSGGGIANCDMSTAEHPKGIAIDATSNDQKWMWANAPQFGLVFYLQATDSVHFVALNASNIQKAQKYGLSGQPLATAQQNLSTGGGCLTAGFTPSNVGSPNTAGTPFDSAIRQALGVPPPPPPPAPVTTPLTQTTPTQTSTATQTGTAATPPAIGTLNSTPYPAGTCTPQTYCAQSDGNIYYRATTCVDQKYQTCAAGCTGLICNATSTTSGGSQLDSLLSLSSNTSQTPDTSSGSSSNASAFDLIDFLGNTSFSAADVGTATPVDITNAVQDAGNTSSLQPTSQNGAVIQTPPQGSIGAYGPVPQQTFASNDLSNSPTSYQSYPSTFQATLAAMKATLLSIAAHLQPFSGIGPFQQTYSE